MTVQLLVSLALRIVVLAVGGLAVAVFRQRASASERHLIWMMTLGAILLLPVALLSLPSIVVAHLPQNIDVSAFTPSQSRITWSIWPVLIFTGWGAGTIACISRLFIAHRRARTMVQHSQRIDPWSESTGVPVHVSSDSQFAFTYGVVHPVIVIPLHALAWPHDLLRATLIHERAHVLRRDGLSLVVSECALALYWWHPAVWFIARKARAEREMACDDAVLRLGILPSDYGTHLLTNALGGDNVHRSLAIASFSNSTGLASRISNLLDARANRSALEPKRAALLVIAVLVLCAGVGSLSSAPSQAQTVIASVLPASPPKARAPITRVTAAPKHRVAPARTHPGKEMHVVQTSAVDDSVFPQLPRLDVKEAGLHARRIGHFASEVASRIKSSKFGGQ